MPQTEFLLLVEEKLHGSGHGRTFAQSPVCKSYLPKSFSHLRSKFALKDMDELIHSLQAQGLVN